MPRRQGGALGSFFQHRVGSMGGSETLFIEALHEDLETSFKLFRFTELAHVAVQHGERFDCTYSVGFRLSATKKLGE